ncbi:hypothetical protein Bca4012_067250 [Brassica carinata]
MKKVSSLVEETQKVSSLGTETQRDSCLVEEHEERLKLYRFLVLKLITLSKKFQVLWKFEDFQEKGDTFISRDFCWTYHSLSTTIEVGEMMILESRSVQDMVSEFDRSGFMGLIEQESLRGFFNGFGLFCISVKYGLKGSQVMMLKPGEGSKDFLVLTSQF